MNITLSVDDEIIRAARRRANALGASVNRLVRDYLRALADDAGSEREATEFVRLSRLSRGNSRGWKFDRDEIHERRAHKPAQ